VRGRGEGGAESESGRRNRFTARELDVALWLVPLDHDARSTTCGRRERGARGGRPGASAQRAQSATQDADMQTEYEREGEQRGSGRGGERGGKHTPARPHTRTHAHTHTHTHTHTHPHTTLSPLRTAVEDSTENCKPISVASPMPQPLESVQCAPGVSAVCPRESAPPNEGKMHPRTNLETRRKKTCVI